MSAPEYVIDLERWESNGAFDVMMRVVMDLEPVNIRRSDGRVQQGRVRGYGHAGLSAVVDFEDGGQMLAKVVATKDLIAWNPVLFPMEVAK